MKQRILVIDDNPDVRLILEVRLHRAGFDVVTAADGAQGVDLAGKHRSALVLVDLNMLGMSGHAFLSTIRDRPSAPQVYAMTDNDAEEFQQEMVRGLGAEGVVSKTEALGRDFPSFLLARLNSGDQQSRTEIPREAQPALAA